MTSISKIITSKNKSKSKKYKIYLKSVNTLEHEPKRVIIPFRINANFKELTLVKFCENYLHRRKHDYFKFKQKYK